MRGRRVLVTGASGFIGSHAARALAAAGADVVALVRPGSRLWRIHDIAGVVAVVESDLTRVGERGSAFRGVDTVLHLAAAGVAPHGRDLDLIETNVLGTVSLLALARKLDLARFVYCGSCFEYGVGSRIAESAPLRPRTAYAASKSSGWLLAEAAAVSDGLPLTTLRPFTVYGPFEAAHRLVMGSVLRALAGLPLELTSGDQQRDFVYVDDAVEAVLAVASNDAALGGVFNVCSGEATAVRDVAAQVAEAAGGSIEIRLGALPHRTGEADILTGDPGHARAVLGFEARTSLREGLARSVAWARRHGSLYDEHNAAGVTARVGT
jgi:nucleoside-diphosphate-sugar epimerase